MPTDQVKLVPVDKLKAHPKNARTHSKKQVRQIADSIECFGFTNPILADENNAVLAGHGRLAAARLIGLREVPTLIVSGLSEAQKPKPMRFWRAAARRLTKWPRRAPPPTRGGANE